jgi:hypothetical protein
VHWGSLFAATFTLASLLVLGLQAGTHPAWAAGTTWYAYAKGTATSPTTCPQSTTTSQRCTLAQALSLAGAGDTVALATPGKAGHYVGNWTVNPAGTSSGRRERPNGLSLLHVQRRSSDATPLQDACSFH